MAAISPQLISIVVPIYNEAAGLRVFHESLTSTLNDLERYVFEIVYCDDGSHDSTNRLLHEMAAQDERIRVIRLTRNFGKEIATTAGIHAARGAAIITIDGDGQHPQHYIGQFLERWSAGAKVVVGVRQGAGHKRPLKMLGSRIFNSGTTDFRLLDAAVQQLFANLTEHNRITRGLIDWLGYTPDYLEFVPQPREHGRATYTYNKLLKLAVDSVIASSLAPLYFVAGIGAIVLPLSVILGLALLANALLHDPLHWRVTGTGYISVALLFLIGLLMVSQGITGLYMSHIHRETQNRPLYVVDREASVGL